MRNEQPKERKIHTALPEDVHQRLPVKCAIVDMSMQKFVSRLLMENLRDVVVTTRKLQTVVRET